MLIRANCQKTLTLKSSRLMDGTQNDLIFQDNFTSSGREIPSALANSSKV